MIPEERRKKILLHLNQHDFLSIDDLKRIFNVSRITIIRDIKVLKEKGLIKKIHGGIKAIENNYSSFETNFNVRIKNNYIKKLEIAQKALNFIYEDQNIFLDSSSTVFVFATELFKKQINDKNVITNSPAIIVEALKNPNINIIVTGGELKQEFNIFGGNWVIEFLEKINIGSAFISAAGISIDGKITTNNKDLAYILSLVINKAKITNLLVDSSKFFKEGMLSIANLSNCKRIITDSQISKEALGRIKQLSGIDIIF